MIVLLFFVQTIKIKIKKGKGRKAEDSEGGGRRKGTRRGGERKGEKSYVPGCQCLALLMKINLKIQFLFRY